MLHRKCLYTTYRLSGGTMEFSTAVNIWSIKCLTLFYFLCLKSPRVCLKVPQNSASKILGAEKCLKSVSNPSKITRASPLFPGNSTPDLCRFPARFWNRAERGVIFKLRDIDTERQSMWNCLQKFCKQFTTVSALKTVHTQLKNSTPFRDGWA